MVVKNAPNIVETQVVEKFVDIPPVLVNDVAIEVLKLMTYEV